jgi:hypothetical protein
VKEDEMGRESSTHGGEGKYIQGFGEKFRRKVTMKKYWSV